MALLEFTEKGIYCPQADVFIDPCKPVAKALITHAHSDHAFQGHKQYLSTLDSVPILKFKLGSFIQIKGMVFGEKISINGVQISFHPAGHIIGSAQIKLDYKGEVWVVSGDYKIEDDGLSGTFESIKCHTFVTESTFGLPSFNWKPQAEIYSDINNWWKTNKEAGIPSILSVYALGKAQRVINNLDQSIGPVFVHGAIENINNVFRNQGYDIQNSSAIANTYNPDKYKNAIILVPPSASDSAWTNRSGQFKYAVVSGWMNDENIKLSRKVSNGFPLSDHADWTGLNYAIKSCGAQKVFVTHGYTEAFTKHLLDKGVDAKVAKTAYTRDKNDF